MRPSSARSFSNSFAMLASGSSKGPAPVRRTDQLARRLDISQIDPHAWNDIPTPAHLQLEAERERRHFARLVEVDLPQLTQFANQFQPPPKSHALQLRLQQFIGETHPAEKGVVLRVSVADLPLKTEASKHKFRVLAGTHWDSVQDSFKLAVERFTSREENARWASQTLDKLLNTANDSTDTMADIPLDPRPTRAKQQRRAKRLGRVTIQDYPQEWLKAAEQAQKIPAQNADQLE